MAKLLRHLLPLFFFLLTGLVSLIATSPVLAASDDGGNDHHRHQGQSQQYEGNPPGYVGGFAVDQYRLARPEESTDLNNFCEDMAVELNDSTWKGISYNKYDPYSWMCGSHIISFWQACFWAFGQYVRPYLKDTPIPAYGWVCVVRQ